MPQTAQIATVIVFLAALLGALLAVRRIRPLPQGRLKVIETRMLGPLDRAALIEAEGRLFLMVASKGAAPVLTPLPEPAR